MMSTHATRPEWCDPLAPLCLFHDGYCAMGFSRCQWPWCLMVVSGRHFWLRTGSLTFYSWLPQPPHCIYFAFVLSSTKPFRTPSQGLTTSYLHQSGLLSIEITTLRCFFFSGDPPSALRYNIQAHTQAHLGQYASSLLLIIFFSACLFFPRSSLYFSHACRIHLSRSPTIIRITSMSYFSLPLVFAALVPFFVAGVAFALFLSPNLSTRTLHALHVALAEPGLLGSHLFLSIKDGTLGIGLHAGQSLSRPQ